VAELFTVCSTLEGLPGFGTQPAELEKCARSDFASRTKGVSYGVTIDGYPTRGCGCHRHLLYPEGRERRNLRPVMRSGAHGVCGRVTAPECC
jgi:hypothetical protein